MLSLRLATLRIVYAILEKDLLPVNASLRKYRDRLRITLILYTFCEPIDDPISEFEGVFKTEMKIQALDFLLRYPDFLCLELIDLMDNDASIDRNEIKNIIEYIYQNNEPVIRVEEMEKFFYGAYESIDDVIAFLESVGFVKHRSRKDVNGNRYDKTYYLTKYGAAKVKNSLVRIESVKWYIDRCVLIKKYFGSFSGSQLKERQYRHKEYKDVSYNSVIQNVNDKVKLAYNHRFQQQLK